MKFQKKHLLLPLLLAVSVPVSAEGVYIGVKAGVMDPDVSGLDEATNAGVVIGYDFAGQNSVNWAVEAEFTTTVSDGDVGSFGEWDVDTQAIYGVLKLGDQVYGKLKAGYLNEDVSANGGGTSVSGDDSGFSGGIGIGWRATPAVTLEAEYTVIEEDLDFISAGVNFFF